MFSHNFPPHTGGLEVVVDELARSLGQRHEITVVSSAWEDAVGVSRNGRITIWRLPALRFAERFGVPYPLPWGRHVRAAMHQAGSADVFHAHGALYAHTLLASTLAKRHRKPLILTEHVGFVNYPSAFVNLLQRSAWRVLGDRSIASSRHVTACSDRVQQWLSQRYPERRIDFVGNGVDLARFHPTDDAQRRALRLRFGLPEDEVLVLFVGRDAPKKNLEDVLQIPRTDFTLVVCGSRRKLVGERLIDLGVVSHSSMSSLYACADMLVHAAEGEGFPLAIQEAMASALPAVIRWDPGYIGNVDVTVVSACDTPDALGREVLRLASDPAARRALGDRGRRWAHETWNWDRAARDFERLYVCANDAPATREAAHS